MQPSNRFRILVLEDDRRVRQELTSALEAAGHVVTPVGRISHAKQIRLEEYSLLLLDLGLPDGDGLAFCSELRRGGQSIPIIALTARDRPEDRVRGLDTGADDYVVKPFHTDELLARIRTVLRRSTWVVQEGRIAHGNWWIEPSARTAGKAGEQLVLTRREFDLLAYLARYPGQTFTRDQLLDRVWGKEYEGDERTVDLHVRRIRERIEDDPGNPSYVLTVWGVGYKFAEIEE